MMEHAVSHLPLLVALGVGIAALIGCYESLPLCLTRQGGQTSHGRIPIEIGNGLDNHDQMILATIDLHLEDAYLALALFNLRPEDLLRVTMAILFDQFRIVGDVEQLHITLGGLVELLDRNSLITHIIYIIYRSDTSKIVDDTTEVGIGIEHNECMDGMVEHQIGSLGELGIHADTLGIAAHHILDS